MKTKRKSIRRFECLVRSVLAVLAVAVLAACGSGGGGGARTAPVDSSPAQLDFGVEMARRGLWAEALFRFKQAERLAPGDPRILNNMAVAYEALGEFDQALEVYQRAIKADRANRDLRRNYSRFIEFYRAFRPDKVEGEAQAEEGS